MSCRLNEATPCAGEVGLQWEGLLADPSRFPSRCTGSAAGRAAANARGNLNYKWAKNVHSRRELIQRGSRLLSAEPPPKWLIDPASIAEVMDDLEQRDSLARLLVSPDGTHDTGPLLPPWLRPPSWLPQCLAQPWEEDIHVALPRLVGCNRLALEPREKAHRVAFMGSVAFCARCACFAHKRLGSRFKGDCQLPHGRARAAVQYRLKRLRHGKHPITGLPLDMG